MDCLDICLEVQGKNRFCSSSQNANKKFTSQEVLNLATLQKRAKQLSNSWIHWILKLRYCFHSLRHRNQYYNGHGYYGPRYHQPGPGYGFGGSSWFGSNNTWTSGWSSRGTHRRSPSPPSTRTASGKYIPASVLSHLSHLQMAKMLKRLRSC